MFKIRLTKGDIDADMPNDKGLRLIEACERADIYKRHNPTAIFSVVNEENGDLEYQI